MGSDKWKNVKKTKSKNLKFKSSQATDVEHHTTSMTIIALWTISGVSPSDCLVSYPGHTVGES